MTTTTPVRGARGIFISISLGLGPDFGAQGGGGYNQRIDVGGKRYGGINLARAGPHKFLL